jgi:hypothetical protein
MLGSLLNECMTDHLPPSCNQRELAIESEDTKAGTDA